jgi:SAM-dependent methyltransferase
MGDTYREDLAVIHDAGFGQFARAAATLLREELCRAGFDRGLVVDLACGSGILSAAMVESGYEALGIDIAPAMVELSRAKVPGATFRVGSIWDADPLPECVAVAAIGECVNYLFDPRCTARALPGLLRRVARALAPGGLFLFDAAGPGRVPGGGPTKGHWQGDGWAVLTTAEEDARRGLVTRRIVTFRRNGDLYRRDEEVHRLRLRRRADVLAQLRAAGYRARTLRAYGEQPLPPGMVGYLAKTPAPR